MVGHERSGGMTGEGGSAPSPRAGDDVERAGSRAGQTEGGPGRSGINVEEADVSPFPASNEERAGDSVAGGVE